MASSNVLFEALVDIQHGMRSNKYTVRSKAIDKLQSIIDNRKIEIVKLFGSNNHSKSSSSSWSQLFDAAHDACIQHVTDIEAKLGLTGLHLIVNKTRDHAVVIQKIIANANSEFNQIPYADILEKCFQCFDNRLMVEHFGMCYLQIVQMHLLACKDNLEDVKINEWSRLLSYCFQLYDNRHIQQKLTVLKCLTPIVVNGSSYTYLSNELVQYLPKLQRIAASNLEFVGLTELISTIFSFCSNLALDYRLTVCGFLESSLGVIIKSYGTRMTDEAKIILFKLLNLAIVLHSPEGNFHGTQTNYAVNQNEWNKHLRQIFYMIQKEIQRSKTQTYRSENNPIICKRLVMLGASLCSVIFWNSSVWADGNEGDEPNKKRKRQADGLKGVMELVEYEKGQFCWRWLSILSELITDHPQAVQPDDYQPLLQLLHNYQSTIKYPVQIQILTVICKILVAEEPRLISTNTAESCYEIWFKIAQAAFRTSASFNLVLAENLRLIQLLITNKHRYIPNTFLSTVLQTIISRQIPKSNEAVKVACAIYRSCNIEAIGDDSELRYNTMAWLYTKRTADSLCETEAIKLEWIAELSVLCVFTKIDIDLVIMNSQMDSCASADNYKCFILNLRRNLLYKSMTRLIALHQDAENVGRKQGLPQLGQLKSVINEQYFEKLFEILDDYDKFELTDNHASDFLAVAAALKLRLRLLDEFLLYESLDAERISDTFLHKQIGLNLDYLELCVQRYAEQSPSMFAEKECMDIVNNLFSFLVNTRHHNVLAKRIIDHPFASMIVWLKIQTQRSSCLNSRSFSMYTLNDLNCENQMRYKALAVVAYFAEGYNERESIAVLSDHNFNFKSNTDLFMVLQLTRTILKQTPSMEKADWAFDNIKKICTMYHRNQCISEQIIDMIPDFVCFIRTYASMTDDMTVVVSSFLAQSRKMKYGPQLTCKLIQTLRFVAKSYPMQLESDSFAPIFRFLGKFLMPQNTLTIQYATIETLSYIFDADWIKNNDHDMLSLKLFHNDLYHHLEIGKLAETENVVDAAGDVDRSSRTISVHIQLFCAIICKNYILRRESWFLLAELCYRRDISKQCIANVILMLCEHLKVDHSTIIEESIIFLLGKWLIKNYKIGKFPWYLTPCVSQSDFFYDYLGIVTVSILRHRPKILADFVPIMPGETMRSVVEPVLPNCLAYLTPLFAKCDNLPLTYKTMGADMYQLLQANFDNLEAINEAKIVQIIQHLILNVWDSNCLREMFGFDIDFEKEDHMIDVAQFKQCLKYIQGTNEAGMRLIPSFCVNHSYRVYQILQYLKLQIQSTRFVEQKIVHLFQFSLIATDVVDFLVKEQIAPKVKKEAIFNYKTFFMQDIIYTLCNILMDNAASFKLKQATSHYLHRFCTAVLPKCANLLGSHLSYVVSALLPLVASGDDQAKLCLHFLVVTHRQPMSKYIAILDNFPKAEIFNEFRSVHMDIKYGGRTFSLADELDYFFKIPKRKTEGMAALRKHLSSKKDELAAVYKTHQDTVGASGDYENGTLHRLIMALLSAIQSSDPKKSMEAAMCLGELGPCDLATIVLKPSSQLNTYKFFATLESAIKNMCHVALSKLSALLLHPDARVLKAASEAIVFLLKYGVGQSFHDEYPTLILFRSPVPRLSPMFSIADNSVLDLLVVFEEEKLSTHAVWLKRFVIQLLHIFGDKHLKNIASIQLLFAETMLPLLVQMLLASQIDSYKDILRDIVVMFFKQHFQLVQNQETVPNGMEHSIYLNRACIKAMLNVSECIRIYNFNNLTKKICLDYLHIGKAALYCDAYFTAIIYVELWALDKATEPSNKEILADSDLQDIMKEAYKALGENDAVMPFLNPITARHTYLQLSGDWNRLNIEHDVQSYQLKSNIELSRNYLTATGLYGLANCLQQTSSGRLSNAAQYECMWRLSDWSAIDVNEPTGVVSSAEEYLYIFEREHYQALKCLQIKAEMGAKASIKLARQSIIGFLRHASLECTNNIYRHLKGLMMIQQIEDFCQVQFHKSDQADGNQNIFDKWKLQDSIGYNDFKYQEPIIAQRVTIFKSAGIRAQRKLQNTFNVGSDGLQSMILNLAVSSRLEGELNMSSRYLATLKTMNTSNEIRSNVWLEDAQLSWQLGDQELAKKLLCHTLANIDMESAMCRARALRIYGEFLAETKSNTLLTLLEQFFKASLTMLDSIEKKTAGIAERMTVSVDSLNEFVLENRILAYEAIAKYADREYNQLNGYLKTALFIHKVERQKQNAKTIEDMGKMDMTKEMRHSYFTLKKIYEIDRNEIHTTEKEHALFLDLALHNYVLASKMKSDSSSLIVFRIISLWFSNKNKTKITLYLEKHFPEIATHNFVPVLPQIVAHISGGDSDFNRTLELVIERCAIEHPQHTIYLILALANAHLDDTSNLKKNPEPRVLGAKKLTSNLKVNQKTTLIVSQMQDMCNALIDFANKDVDSARISSKEPIRKLKNLNLIHCPTLNLPISKSGNYPDMITVFRWSETMSMVGGVNKPKKMSCHCSDGKEYPQLLKGRDDPRQDAIMQQVFTIMNGMLRSHKEARKRRLNVKTYKVVPLSQRSGLLEWCSNSVPLSDYLVGSSKNPGAHERYHPKDLKPAQCRHKLSVANQNKTPLAQKLELYTNMCTQIRPAFQYFFFERFLKPGEWFERRLTYTNSVATTSMIGYILGIGDRHVSNILIDEKTADLIHIDFGIAFEQGKCLPTPETIPFRLTRDIVAPFGVSGVNGIFRKSCENTMEVLRSNKNIIITILEVLLYDPLCAWALTTKKAYSKQDIQMEGNDDCDQKNSMAERALGRLEAKLNGNEEGTAGGTSTIEAHVEYLITQAVSQQNLCRLFAGWQSYL